MPTQGVPRPTFPVPPDDYDRQDESRFRRLVEQFMTSASGALTRLGEDLEGVEDSIPTIPTEVVFEAWGGTSPIEVSDSSTGDKTTEHTLTTASDNGTYQIQGWWYRDLRGTTGAEYGILIEVDPDGVTGYAAYDTITWNHDDAEDDAPLTISVLDASLEAGGKIRLTLSSSGTALASGDETILTPQYIIGL